MRNMEFPHKAPKGYEYWTDDYSKTIKRIWIRNISREFIYGDDKHPSSVWGFFCRRKGVFLAPVNSKKPGKVVNPNNTTPYTAMQLKLTPLELAFQ